MKNIYAIYEAASSEAELDAKIREICGKDGVYDRALEAWVYMPLDAIFYLNNASPALGTRELAAWEKAVKWNDPRVCGLTLFEDGRCAMMFNDVDDTKNWDILSYGEILSRPVRLPGFEFKIAKPMLKEMIGAILTHKPEKNIYSSPTVEKSKKPEGPGLSDGMPARKLLKSGLRGEKAMIVINAMTDAQALDITQRELAEWMKANLKEFDPKWWPGRRRVIPGRPYPGNNWNSAISGMKLLADGKIWFDVERLGISSDSSDEDSYENTVMRKRPCGARYTEEEIADVMRAMYKAMLK